MLQADSQTCCKDAATFISSYKCFVALGNTLSLLEGRSEGGSGRPDPPDSFTAASGFSSVVSGVHCREARAGSAGLGGFSRLVSLSAHLLFLILGYFYSFPGLYFLLCILFLLPNFLPAIWMLSKIVS